MRRKLLLALIPMLTIGGPPLALWAHKWWVQSGSAKWAALTLALGQGNAAPARASGPMGTPTTTAAGGDPGIAPENPGGPSPSTPLAPSLRLEGQAPSDLGAVFRFDATPGWVMARWPRVSAGLAELKLQGYRVPLVTGTGTDDLAGGLTYYFNPRQQLQKITFQGTTGDTRKLVDFLVKHHRFGRRLTNDPRLFRYEVALPDRPAKSFLEIRPARVVKSAEAYHRFDVFLAIERPEG